MGLEKNILIKKGAGRSTHYVFSEEIEINCGDYAQVGWKNYINQAKNLKLSR